MIKPEGYMKMVEAAKFLGIDRKTLLVWCDMYQIKHLKIKNGPSQRPTYLIERAAFDKFITDHCQAGPEALKKHPGRPRVIPILGEASR